MKHQPFISSLDPYREFFEEMDDIFLILNQSGKIEYVNRALRRHLGYARKRFTGRSILEAGLFAANMRKKEILNQIFSQRDFNTRVKRKNGDFSYAWRTKILTHKGKKKVIAVVRDMTSQLQFQEKVEHYTENLEEMVFQRTQQLEQEKQKAIALHQAKVAFLSKMSHELRTPLTAIRGYAELLQEIPGALDQETHHKYVSVIEKNAVHLLNMITETLQIIQMEQNKYQVQEKVFELKPFLQDLLETYTVLTKKKGLLLEAQIPDDISKLLYSDPNALRQILTNLIGNAIQFTEKGKIVLSIKERTLAGSLSRKLYFYIEDTGVGIPRDQHQRIFKSFEQYLGHQSIHGRGTGLGLPISRQLAKLLGGEVKLVSSEPYKGSVFVFALKLRKLPKTA